MNPLPLNPEKPAINDGLGNAEHQGETTTVAALLKVLDSQKCLHRINYGFAILGHPIGRERDATPGLNTKGGNLTIAYTNVHT